MTGKFITLEGVEGAGKSTAISVVEQYLTDSGVEFVQTREPGGTALGEKIREVLLDKDNSKMSANTELLLMFAARAQHLREKIIPALDSGQWVVCDRFTDATYAYQGGGRKLPIATIQTLENLVQNTLRPDLVMILDVPPEIGLERVAKRGATDRFEQEAVSFFNRVREVYLSRAKDNPERYKIIDATNTIDGVKNQIEIVLKNLFK